MDGGLRSGFLDVDNDDGDTRRLPSRCLRVVDGFEEELSGVNELRSTKFRSTFFGRRVIYLLTITRTKLYCSGLDDSRSSIPVVQ